MRVGQPVVQRHEAHFGPIAHEQEDERQRQHRRLEVALDVVELGPQQCAASGPQQFFRGEVKEDRSEQRLRNADAAENEILPRGFETGGRPVERHQQHGRQRRGLQRDPEDAHVVGEQRQKHREIEELIHAVIKAQAGRRKAAVLLFDAHVGLREYRCGKADKGGQRDQEHVEWIDEELAVEDQHRSVRDDAHGQCCRGQERRETHGDVDPRRNPLLADKGQERRAGQRQSENEEDFDHPRPSTHRCAK